MCWNLGLVTVHSKFLLYIPVFKLVWSVFVGTRVSDGMWHVGIGHVGIDSDQSYTRDVYPNLTIKHNVHEIDFNVFHILICQKSKQFWWSQIKILTTNLLPQVDCVSGSTCLPFTPRNTPALTLSFQVTLASINSCARLVWFAVGWLSNRPEGHWILK